MTPPTAAEIDLLRRLAVPGASVRSVAHDLGMTESQAKARLHRLYRRLGVHSALQAWEIVRATKVAPQSGDADP